MRKMGGWVAAAGLGLALLTSACTHAVPTAQPRALSVRATKLPSLGKIVTANVALSYAHGVAQRLDAKAAFTSLVGMRIGNSGAPTKGGSWQAHYVGSPIPGDNPYQSATRRIVVTIDAGGQPSVSVTEEPGMPLGVSFSVAPIPELDSQQALAIAREHESKPHRVYTLMLSGSVTPSHMQRLVWRVSTLEQSNADVLTLDANSGDVLPIKR